MRSVRSFRFAIVAAIVVMLLAAVRHSASVSVTLVVTVAGLLGTIAWLVGRNIRRQADGIEALRAVKEGLEREAEARAADLRDANARLRSIIDSAVDGIIVIDVQGRIEAFNRGAERLFGYPESEVLGRNVSVLMPSPDHEQHDGYLARFLETGTGKIIGIGRQVTGRRRNGTTFPLHLSVGEMVIHGERKFTGIVHDLSARVQVEQQLREQAAMARLGEMAAVIAHEVKNPLAGVRGGDSGDR